MKKYLLMFVMSAFAISVNAESTYKAVCYDTDMCEVNGMDDQVDLADLPKYVPFADTKSGYDCQGITCTNKNFQVVGLNPDYPAFAGKQGVVPQSAPQPALTSDPFKVSVHDKVNTYVSNGVEQSYSPSKILTILTVAPSITIKNVVVNRDPGCTSVNPAAGIKFKERVVKMGNEVEVNIFCRPVEVVIETDYGPFSYNFQ